MKELLTALAKAKREFDPILKDRTNDFFNAKYATLGAVLKAVGPALDDNGLTVVQTTAWHDIGDSKLASVLYTTLFHIESGESLKSSWALVPVKNDPQGMGSALTYGRRYALMTMFGLNAEDDDGNAAAMHRPSKDWNAELVKAKTAADARTIWALAEEAGDLTDALKQSITSRGAFLKEQEDKAKVAPATEPLTEGQVAEQLNATEVTP